MPRFVSSIASLFAVAVLAALVSGCQRPIDACTEFDPPPNKEATACPPKAAAIQAQPALPARYCYSSLAQIECYPEPQPGRAGYMGSTEAPPPGESVTKVKADPAVSSTGAAAPPPLQPAAAQPVAAAQPPSPAATGAPMPLKPASAN